jgi:beta-lactamase superfamily II metal-dependent hydrolase
MMQRHRQLKPVHFYKIGHHGSCNGTPPPELLDAILPRSAPDARPRYALLSTCPGAYEGVPHPATVSEIRRRVDRVYSTRSVGLGRPLEIVFDAD